MKKLTAAYIGSLIMPRNKNAHKGDFGHVMIVAGSRGMTGAAVLSGYGALRCGAGLVTVAVPETQQNVIAAHIRPEAMTLGLPDKVGKFSSNAYKKIIDFITKRKVSSMVLGPGIGKSSEITKLVKKLLNSVRIPLVLDADGLNALSGSAGLLKKAKADVIITPHPGELSRLSGLTAGRINKNRIESAENCAKKYGVVCVLKGHKTVISEGTKTFVNSTGNPGMASGGTGDVLSGMIAALLPQVKEPKLLNAAIAGVYFHGLAGDMASKVNTQIGLLAEDLAEAVPNAIKKALG